MFAKPAMQSVSVRQFVIAMVGVLMVVAAVMAGALIGEAVAPDSPAEAVVVVDSADGSVLGGGRGSGSGGVTGGGMLGGTLGGAVGGSGGVVGR